MVKLHLFWNDSNLSAGGLVKNLAGLTDLGGGPSPEQLRSALVAVLRITKVTRKAGQRRYETTIEAQERVYRKLVERLGAKLDTSDPGDAVTKLCDRAGVPAKLHPLRSTGAPAASPGAGSPGAGAAGEAPGNDKRTFPQGAVFGRALTELAKSVEQTTRRTGRGLLLVRDGTLHFGVRPIPLEGDPKELTLASGLIETLIDQPLTTDPSFTSDDPAKPKERQRRQIKLVLKGRPDIKPGDAVKLDLPPEDLAKTTPSLGAALVGAVMGALVPTLGGLTAKAVTLYVTSVGHKLGRTTGFVTNVTGVEYDAAKPDDAWDTRTPSGAPDAGRSTGPSGAAAESVVQAAHAVRQVARDVVGANRFAEVGEVRRLSTRGGPSAEPPAQTETVWRGLAPADGRPHQARRLPVERKQPAPAEGVTYATPFAWGPCGLILPRYPGTRVLLLHRNGQDADPVDVGAIWQSGHVPQEAHPGDWWLILPVGATAREAVEDTVTPQEHSGKATNDLIDADGNRVIEVGELTIRVGRASLANAGKRPQRAEKADSVTIEHADGEARIVIEKNGGITIDAGSGDITMSAANVKVKVSGTMDVSGV